jgi:hypothetical protein
MWLKTTTELRYPKMEKVPLKYDNFHIPDADALPPNWREMSGNEKYDWANENGYWLSGFWEITTEQETFIEENELHGAQDEVVTEWSES